jgi:hypothetical protein
MGCPAESSSVVSERSSVFQIIRFAYDLCRIGSLQTALKVTVLTEWEDFRKKTKLN